MYRISDLIYFIIYYVLSYRKSIVLENLKNSFPEKSEDEIKVISKKFFRFFCDLMLETFKTLTMSEKEAKKRCVFDLNSFNLLEELFRENKDVILVLGHYGNWEFGGTSFSSQCSHQLYVIYKPLSNRYFDRLIYKMRARWGTNLIPIKETYAEMKKTKNTCSTTAFIADQTPSPDNAYWTTFLNQHTPVFWGTERIAIKLNYPIVYMTIKRIKRGYYKIFTEMLFDNPRQTKAGEISEAHTQKLEKDIFEQPEIWLWSHRRWKHTDKTYLKN
jgi:KDO2-lipid IV(A) lauroyltransferase